MNVHHKKMHNQNTFHEAKEKKSTTPEGKKRKSFSYQVFFRRSNEDLKNLILKKNDIKEGVDSDSILSEDEKNIIINSNNIQNKSLKEKMDKSKIKIQNLLSELKKKVSLEEESYKEKKPFLKTHSFKRMISNNELNNKQQIYLNLEHQKNSDLSKKKKSFSNFLPDKGLINNNNTDCKSGRDSKNDNESANFLVEKSPKDYIIDNTLKTTELTENLNKYINYNHISSKPNYNDFENNILQHPKSKSRSLSVSRPSIRKDIRKPSYIKTDELNSENSPLTNNFISKDCNKEKDNIRVLQKFKNVYDSFSDEENDLNYEETIVFLISPESTFKVSWDIFLFILIIYSAIVSSFRIAFNLDTVLDFYYFLDVLIDIAFIIDFILNFFIPYYDYEENLVLNYAKIRNKYLKSWFTIDLISSYPSYLLDLLFWNKGMPTQVSELKLLNIYRFLKWIRMARFSKIGKSHFTEVLFPNFSLSNDDGVNRAVKFSISLILLVHISSCFWIFLGRANFEVTWIKKADLDDSSFMDIYIASLYFNLVTIFSIGYGDILSTNITEKFYNSLFMIVGTFLFSFTISCFSTIFGKMDEKKVQMKKKLEMLQKFESEFNIPYELSSKISKTIKHQIKKSNSEKYKLLDELTNNLKNQLSFLMNKENIKNLIFFKNKPHDFIIFVIPLLKPIISNKGDRLFSEGEYVDEIYFVVKGRLSIQLGQLYDNIDIAHILTNQHFGEILMYTNEHSPYNLNVKTKVSDILVLKKSDFSKVKISFNDIILEILSKSYTFLEQIEKRKRIIQLLYRYENSVNEVRRIMIKLNNYILEKDFDRYYYYDNSFRDAVEFLENDNFDEVKDILFKDKAILKKKEDNINLNEHFINSFVENNKSTIDNSTNELPIVLKVNNEDNRENKNHKSILKNNKMKITESNKEKNLSNNHNFSNLINKKSSPKKEIKMSHFPNDNNLDDMLLNDQPFSKNNEESSKINTVKTQFMENIHNGPNQININLYNYESNLNQRFIIYQNNHESFNETIKSSPQKTNNSFVVNQKSLKDNSNEFSFKENNIIDSIYKDTLNEKDLEVNLNEVSRDEIDFKAKSLRLENSNNLRNDLESEKGTTNNKKLPEFNKKKTSFNVPSVQPSDNKFKSRASKIPEYIKSRKSIVGKIQSRIFQNFVEKDNQQNVKSQNNRETIKNSNSIQKILDEIDLDAATHHIHHNNNILEGLKDFIDENEENKILLFKSIKKLDKIMKKLEKK